MSRHSSGDRKHKRRSLIEQLEQRQLLAADAFVLWQDIQTQPLLAETVDVRLDFANRGDAVGYGPYVDLIIPNGQQGGVDYVQGSASFLSSSVGETVLTFDSEGKLQHPFAVDSQGQPLWLTANPNDQLIVAELPLGSFAASQPAVQLDLQLAVDADAEVGHSYEIAARGGFRYGSDALDNPTEDPILLSESASLEMTPGVVRAQIEYLGPENETASGQNFVQTYLVSIDVAEGTRIEQAEISSLFDPNVAFSSVGETRWQGDAMRETVVPDRGALGAEMMHSLSTWTGLPGIDGSYTVDVHVPEFDADGNRVIDLRTNNAVETTFAVTVNGHHVRQSDDGERIELPVESVASHELAARAIAVQQTMEVVNDRNVSGLGPGDVLEYALHFQVSDHMSLDDVALLTSVPDGQVLLQDRPAVFQINGFGDAERDGSEILTSLEMLGPQEPGEQTLHFDISHELRERGFDGQLWGGFTTHGDGPVTGSLRYQTLVMDQFDGTVPSGDASVDEGDQFVSQSLVSGMVVDPATAMTLEHSVSDGSGTSSRLRVGELESSVYAINGNFVGDGIASTSAGDTVTYRVKKVVRSGDIEDLQLSQFFPLPIHQLDSMKWVEGGKKTSQDHGIRLGPDDDFHDFYELTPSVTVDKDSSEVRLRYGSVDTRSNESRTLDLLFTVAVEDQPFADGMWLTSVTHQSQGTSNAGIRSQDAIASIQYTRPVLTLEKSVQGVDNPNATVTPQGDVTGVDAGDRVRFQIVIENEGLSSDGAFDVLLKDVVPDGFSIPESGLDPSIRDGRGNEIELRHGSFDGLFGDGIELKNPIPSASTDAEGAQIRLSYELIVGDQVQASESIFAEAEVLHYAAIAGGNNYVTAPLRDETMSRIADPDVRHERIDTDQEHTSGKAVVIGETVTYRVTVVVPEGAQNDSELMIELPRGMAIQSVDSLNIDDTIELRDWKAPLNDRVEILPERESRDQGRRVRVQLGDLVNRNRDNRRGETIELVYSATVTNDRGNDAGDGRRSKVHWSTPQGRFTKSSSAVRVVEPALAIQRSWDTRSADAQDRVKVYLDVTSANDFGADAFEVSMSESIAAGSRYVPGSFRWVSGPVPEQMNEQTLSATWKQIPVGQTTRLSYDVIVDEDVHAGSELASTAMVTWSSLPGEPGSITDSNALAVERTGDSDDLGGSSNDYRTFFQSSLPIDPVQISMTLSETSADHTQGRELTIGEQAVYDVNVVVPEGLHRLSFESFDAGLAAPMTLKSVQLVSVGDSLDLSASVGDLGELGEDGSLRFDLGEVRNQADQKSDAGDELRFRIVAMVPDVAGNRDGENPSIRSRVRYQFGTASAEHSATIVEPGLVADYRLESNVDAGDTVNVVLKMSLDPAMDRAAFSLRMDDLTGATGLSLVPGSVSASSGSVTKGNGDGDRRWSVSMDRLDAGDSLEVRYQLRVAEDVAPGHVLKVAGDLRWQSMTGEQSRTYRRLIEREIHVNEVAVSGRVYVDANQNGVAEYDDYGLGNVGIVLAGTDHLGNTVRQSLETQSNGNFRFEGLRPGSYSIDQIQPSNISDGSDYAGSAGGTALNDRIESLVIPTGTDGEMGGYHFTESPLTWISGTVFFDQNQDGVLGQDEAGLSGVLISLSGRTDSGESIRRTTQTNNRGYYVFGHLFPGTYDIVEGATETHFDAAEQLGSNGGLVHQDAFSDVIVGSNDPGEHYNFGEYRPSELNGHVYLDYDRDGLLDRKDGLIAGVEVVLTGINDMGEVVEDMTQTDAQGRYRFNELRPGTYKVASQSMPHFGESGEQLLVNRFDRIQMEPGFRAVAYDIGHVDPDYQPSIMQESFESQMIVAGTSESDQFRVFADASEILVEVNEETFRWNADETRSLRLLGSFGDDSLGFVGSENKETVELRKGSARITGTWFETLVYGMERIHFEGGGNEDLARFYDTIGDDTLEGQPQSATLAGDGYRNSVADVHRIYAYTTQGHDVASFLGETGSRDNFLVTPEDAKLYGAEFYLFGRGFDSVVGTATDRLDRAYLFGSIMDDQLSGDADRVRLSNANFNVTAKGYTYTNVLANQGGNDVARLNGSSGDDQFLSRPTMSILDTDGDRIIAKGFSNVIAEGSGGYDVATVYDTHYDDEFKANHEFATLQNAVSRIEMNRFDRVNAFLDAGGNDVGTIEGSPGSDLFKASPDRWTMQGTGYYLLGTGFTGVTAFGDSRDKAYLYDSAFDDVLELSAGSATLRGERFSNTARGFAKINSEASGGQDRVIYQDSAARSTVRVKEEKTTVFGKGFSYSATSFDTIDAYYADLNGRDNVELEGRIDFEWVDSTLQGMDYHLALQVNDESDVVKRKVPVSRLS